MAFMNPFKKEACNICGKEVRGLGKKKVEDGMVCSECVKKLSPFFSDRKASTVDQIKAQLDYREANKADVAAFHTTRTLGNGSQKLYIDEDARKFMVTSANPAKLAEVNPDVLDYDMVTGCDTEIEQHEDEIKRKGADNKMVSYNPPRYKYRYDFYVRIYVNHPYFDEIRMQINSGSVEYNPYGTLNAGKTTFVNGVMTPVKNVLMGLPMYEKNVKAQEEIKAVLTAVREEIREEIESGNQPVKPVVCEYCGATTVPDAAGCCEYCGSPIA